ncbi:MAG: hypothetical protein NZ934_05050, partial [Hadesarchaea archaeon]|nr:hypothetical protein [Hadesarchaea archaeon]
KMKNMLTFKEHQLGRDAVKILDLYISDPSRAMLLEADGLPILDLLLRNLSDLIQSEKLGLDAKEREKKLRQVQSLLNSGALPKFQGQYRKLLNEISMKKLEYERSPLHGRKVELERSVQEKRARLDLTTEKLNTVAAKIGEVEHELQENAAELERISAKVFGKPVKLV